MTPFNNLVLSKVSMWQLWQLYGRQSCQHDNFDNQRPIHLVPNFGCHNDNVLVVKADNLDNLLGDNHKGVILTTSLTTFRQCFVLCAGKGCLVVWTASPIWGVSQVMYSCILEWFFSNFYTKDGCTVEEHPSHRKSRARTLVTIKWLLCIRKSAALSSFALFCSKWPSFMKKEKKAIWSNRRQKKTVLHFFW